MQIRTRLTIQFIATVAGILLLALGFIYLRYAKSMEDEFYRGLRSKAIMTAEMVLRQEDLIRPEAHNNGQSNELLPVNEALSIFDMERRRVFALNPPPEPLPAPTFADIQMKGECRIRYAQLPALGLRHTSRSGIDYVVVAASVYETEELLKLRRILTASFFVVLGMVALGGWFFAGQALAPMEEVMNAVDKVLPADLSARLKEPGNRDEIARLVQTFNRMLDRIHLAFQMQRRFVSNVSHELKNPLSVIIAQLEVALDQAHGVKEYRDTARSVLEDSRNMALITERLLQMARVYSDNANVTLSPLRLDEVIDQTKIILQRSKPAYRVDFKITGILEYEKHIIIDGNEALLRLALINLMENACKFSPDRRAEVTLTPGSAPVLEVRDCGPGIPPEDLPMIFQPFYRGAQQTKTAGSGIGLSLAESILNLHNAKIEIESEPGKGTNIKILFSESGC
jgi:signal transduction histidine kinase